MPTLRQALCGRAGPLAPAVPFVCYPVLLCLLNVQWFALLRVGSAAALTSPQIARTVFVPGITFWGGTILRARLNLPRPYEQPGFEPLRPRRPGPLLPIPPRAERCRAGHGAGCISTRRWAG